MSYSYRAIMSDSNPNQGVEVDSFQSQGDIVYLELRFEGYTVTHEYSADEARRAGEALITAAEHANPQEAQK